MQNLVIRRFDQHDAAIVSEIICRNFLEVNIKDYSKEEMEGAAKIYDSAKVLEIAHNAHMYVACLDKKIVGCGAISSLVGKQDESKFNTIFVLPELQGKGIGRSIIETLEMDEYFLNAKRIEIASSITAYDFYIKFGYHDKDGIRKLDVEGHYKLEKYREIVE
jgi:N-acetylglutamate synthase-like GNAT family acetyltransferase